VSKIIVSLFIKRVHFYKYNAERDALEDTVIRSYKKTKALFEKSDDYLTKIGMGDFVRDNNQELENSMIQFRKSFTEYMEK